MDNYVAWCRYFEGPQGTAIFLCNSDAPGAFKVYREPPTKSESCVMVPLDAAIEAVGRYLPASLTGKRTQIKQALQELAAKPAEDYKALYMELIYQVQNVRPGLTRHQAAKQIIHDCEHQNHGPEQVES